MFMIEKDELHNLILPVSSFQESEGGLYVCMNSFLGFGSQYVDRHHARAGQRAYFHITRTRKAKVDTVHFCMIYFCHIPIICSVSLTHLIYSWHYQHHLNYELLWKPFICDSHLRKMIATLDLDTHLRRSLPDWLLVRPARILKKIWAVWFFDTNLCLSCVCIGIEGGFDVEQEQYEEDVKVVILPDRQEVTSDDLATMADVVRERVRFWYPSKQNAMKLPSFYWGCRNAILPYYIGTDKVSVEKKAMSHYCKNMASKLQHNLLTQNIYSLMLEYSYTCT